METSCSVKEWAGHRPEDSCQGHSGLSGCDSSCFSFSDRTENSEQKLHRGSGMGDECCECGLTGPSPKLSCPWTSWFNIYTARGNLWIWAGSVLWCHPFLFSPDTKAFMSARTLPTMGHLLLLWTTYSAIGPYETEKGLPSFGSLSGLWARGSSLMQCTHDNPLSIASKSYSVLEFSLILAKPI